MTVKKKRGESARHHRVYPGYWTNNPHWSDDAKMLGLFLLTGPHRRTEGLYRLPVAYMAGDLAWTEKRTRQALGELVADGFVAYDERVGVVFIPKALKHQGLDNPNQITAALNALGELPRTDLLVALGEAAERFSQPFAQRLRERFPELLGDGLPEPMSHPPAPTPTKHPLTPSRGKSAAVPPTVDDVPPTMPDGNRKTDVAAYETAFEAWAHHHFPGSPNAAAVQSALTFARLDEPSASALGAWASVAPAQWAGLLGIEMEAA